MTAAREVVGFLRRHPPFDGLSDAELDRIAALTEIEVHPAGQTVLTQGAEPADRVRVVRSGSVELICDGHVLDLLGVGELFGQASMMSGLPAGFTARTAEATEVCSLPAAAVQTLLARPGALRFLVRSAIADPVAGAGTRPPEPDPLRRAAGSLVRRATVRCGPDEPIRDAARTMTELGAGAIIVELPGAMLGIITDTDLRTRVVATGLDAGAPVRAIMTTPVFSVAADSSGGDALLEMVQRGIRHLPVLGAAGQVLGVLEDHDLVVAATRTPFVLRRQIDRAVTSADVVAAAQRLGPAVVALYRGGADAGQLCALWSMVVDALVRRLVRSALAGVADPPEFTWLALGSLARRETVPSSDVDSALCWPSADADAEVLRQVAGVVGAGLAACGLKADQHQVSAADPLFARPLAAWQGAAHSLILDPSQPNAQLLISVLVDNRAVWGQGAPHDIALPFTADRSAPTRDLMLRLLAREALVHKPPTGFLRDFVVESGGTRRGRLDLKRGGVLPIVTLARWSGLRAGVVTASTPERLRAAGAAGTLAAGDAETLIESFEVIGEVRMHHQVAQLEAGLAPDDFLDPRTLSSIARARLKETFRAIATVQRSVQADLRLTTA